MDRGLEQEIREALVHLYDPGYAPSAALCELLECDRREGTLAVQTAVLHAIDRLAPSEEVGPGSFARQVHELLHARFVEQATLEQTAERLHLSYSSTWRLQRTAIHELTRSLWESHHAPPPIHGPPADQAAMPRVEDSSKASPPNWTRQARRELASLMARAPSAESDVSAVIENVMSLAPALPSREPLRVQVGFAQPDLMAALHPSVLRQILIAMLGRLARFTLDGRITVFARQEEGSVRITLSGAMNPRKSPGEHELVADVLPLDGVSFEAHLEGDNVFLWVVVPAVGSVAVLVVDDNPDMMSFYRRATDGTGYHILQPGVDEDLLDAARRLRPDLIVLDVVLPDVDGWQLLIGLREDPVTCDTPVLVCTVIREPELALSLGASAYVSKPVSADQFIEALDTARADSASIDVRETGSS